MQFVLSNAALPSEDLSVLRCGARHRELKGLELVVGGRDNRSTDSLGRIPSMDPRVLKEGRPPVRWLLLEVGASLTDLLYWSRQGRTLRKTGVDGSSTIRGSG